MDKIIFANGETLDFSKVSNVCFGIIVENKTVGELETLFTKENLSTVKFINSANKIYSNYTNLECVSITKYIESGEILIALKATTTTS